MKKRAIISVLAMYLGSLAFLFCLAERVEAQSQPFLVSAAGEFWTLTYDRFRDRVYFTNKAYNQVEVYDVETNQLLSPIYVGSQPWGVDITPDGSKLVVANYG